MAIFSTKKEDEALEEIQRKNTQRQIEALKSRPGRFLTTAAIVGAVGSMGTYKVIEVVHEAECMQLSDDDNYLTAAGKGLVQGFAVNAAAFAGVLATATAAVAVCEAQDEYEALLEE